MGMQGGRRGELNAAHACPGCLVGSLPSAHCCFWDGHTTWVPLLRGSLQAMLWRQQACGSTPLMPATRCISRACQVRSAAACWVVWGSLLTKA
jgi:hypothetical protein